jgi:hypothetical protein
VRARLRLEGGGGDFGGGGGYCGGAGGGFNGEGLGGGGCSFLDSIVTENVSLASENINNGFGTISRVPEPSTWVMMLLGLACLGFAGYRRAKRGSAAFAD